MLHTLIKASAALALGSFAFAHPAGAVSSHPLQGPAFVIPAADEENEEVWHDLRPDVTPPDAAVGTEGKAAKDSATEPPKGEGSSGDEENEEVWHDLRPNINPPPAAVGE
jgi:hypothetical protein